MSVAVFTKLTAGHIGLWATPGLNHLRLESLYKDFGKNLSIFLLEFHSNILFFFASNLLFYSSSDVSTLLKFSSLLNSLDMLCYFLNSCFVMNFPPSFLVVVYLCCLCFCCCLFFLIFLAKNLSVVLASSKNQILALTFFLFICFFVFFLILVFAYDFIIFSYLLCLIVYSIEFEMDT